MSLADQHRIDRQHLDRGAIVYIRQSDPRQVREHLESTALQRGLLERAIELGWPKPKLIEDDLGISAGGFAERPGFQWLLTQVTLRKVGVILCMDASRLSRNSTDWAQLFQLCGYFDTLIADAQQVYDISVPNDRLVLHIKGTVAELELSSLKDRLHAGLEAKAARGELKVVLPPGYVYDADDQIIMDPDERVQQALRSMFEQFEHTTSVRQLALTYLDSHTLFPIRKPGRRGGIEWKLPPRYVLQTLLGHPIYAGVYSRGRTQQYIEYAEGKLVKRTRRISSPDDWRVRIADHHEAYITWEQYLENRAKLADARPRWAMDDNRTAVREGKALLAGILRCGHCGRKLRVIYNRASSAMYHCDGGGPRGTNRCLSFGGKYVDDAISEQLCRAVEPLAIEAAERAFALEQEERERSAQQARLRVQQAQYNADRAFEQYDLADPKNRLVADNLEKRLNEKLAEVQAAQQDLDRRIAEQPPLTEEQREEIRSLSRDFPRLWTHEDTPTELRKQLLRVAIREVVVRRENHQLIFTVHWVGETCTQVTVTKRSTPVGCRTDPSLTELVRELAKTLGDGEIARILNMKKLLTPRGLLWTQTRVSSFRTNHRIKKGKVHDDPELLNCKQAREYLGISWNGLQGLVRRGVLDTNQVTDFAPWRLSRAELDSDEVQSLVAALKANGRLPSKGEYPENQRPLFSAKSTNP